MNIKSIIFLLMWSVTLLISSDVFANHSPGNLYVTFHNPTQGQTLYVDVLDESNHNQHKTITVQCNAKKAQPSCGFGFKNLPVAISQIRYNVLGKSAIRICSELDTKKFSYGKLIIYSGSNMAEKPHCNFIVSG